MLRIGLGINPWRGLGTSLLALSSSLVTFVDRLERKMSRTRRTLGSLGSYVNVNGEEALRRRVVVERTHVERQAIRMHERREETWRPLNRRLVVAFLELYFLAMIHVENAHRYGHQSEASRKMLKKALVRRIIPWIYHNRVWTMDKTLWPITLEQFEELDTHMAGHLPRLRAGHQ